MGFSKIVLLGVLGLFAFGAYSETSGDASGGSAASKPGRVVVSPLTGSSSGNINPGTLKVFDENFFTPPTGSNQGKPEVNSAGRTYGPDADYNTEQREQWLAKCAPYRDQDVKLFRDCFQREREKMKLELREKFDAVERRQGRGNYSIENLLQPSKSSGGFD